MYVSIFYRVFLRASISRKPRELFDFYKKGVIGEINCQFLKVIAIRHLQQVERPDASKIWIDYRDWKCSLKVHSISRLFCHLTLHFLSFFLCFAFFCVSATQSLKRIVNSTKIIEHDRIQTISIKKRSCVCAVFSIFKSLKTPSWRNKLALGTLKRV